MLRSEIDTLLDERIIGLQMVNEGCSIEGKYCAKCGFFSQKKFKKEMTESELFLLDAYNSMPDKMKNTEVRNFIPFKSANNVWCMLCEKCYQSENKSN